MRQELSWFFASSAALEKKFFLLQVLEGGFLDLRGLEMGLYLTFWGRRLRGWGLQLCISLGCCGMWLFPRSIWFIHRPKLASDSHCHPAPFLLLPLLPEGGRVE